MQKGVKRPVPLVFILIFTVVVSFVHLLGGFGPVFKGAANYLILFLGLLYFLMGVAGFAAVFGLWMWYPWANLLTRLIYFISIPLGLWDIMLNSSSGNVAIQLFNIGLNVWIIWYLTRAETKALFGATRQRKG